METLLHYVWKYKFFSNVQLETTDGQPLEIIDPGLHNTHAGPDFFNAKIRIGQRLWAGNVEIHSRSSDWYTHRHERDKAYNSVILHVVEIRDTDHPVTDESGRSIPQVCLQIPESIRQNYELLQSARKEFPPCAARVREIPRVYLTDWMSALACERLDRKTDAVRKLLSDYKGDWNAVFYIVLSRNFGFGINNDAFERLARSLPLKYLLKHKDSTVQTEALFFGQAGLLEADADDNAYCLSLQQEYRFLRAKYRLKPLEAHLFKSLRIRPNNFPHIKIAQLASFSRSIETLFSKIIETLSLDELRKCFVIQLPEYWLTHYRFGKVSVKRQKVLGISAVNLILINTVGPLLAAYGKTKQRQDLYDRACRLYEQLPPERNSITLPYEKAGISMTNACDSQALIQLKQAYCDPHKCIYCRIGYKLLSKQPDADCT